MNSINRRRDITLLQPRLKAPRRDIHYWNPLTAGIGLPTLHSGLGFPDFLFDKPSVEVQWREKRSWGASVLNMVIGAFVALFFLGLPLAIIGLFIASTLERRSPSSREVLDTSPESTPSASVVNHGDRRRIAYGRYSMVTTGAAERDEPASIHSRKA